MTFLAKVSVIMMVSLGIFLVLGVLGTRIWKVLTQGSELSIIFSNFIFGLIIFGLVNLTWKYTSVWEMLLGLLCAVVTLVFWAGVDDDRPRGARVQIESPNAKPTLKLLK